MYEFPGKGSKNMKKASYFINFTENVSEKAIYYVCAGSLTLSRGRRHALNWLTDE